MRQNPMARRLARNILCPVVDVNESRNSRKCDDSEGFMALMITGRKDLDGNSTPIGG